MWHHNTSRLHFLRFLRNLYRNGDPSMNDDRIAFSCEVSEALASGQAVVALESTVIAQGLPWPANFETAQAVQAAVLGAGVAPATIAVLDGLVRIGLTDGELLRVASSAAQMPEVMDGVQPHLAEGRTRCPLTKANRRDLAAVVARSGSATTTVSATLWIAGRYGLNPRVLATGGLGGVHCGAGATFDVSTDLDELARADGVLIVCSGIKSILDVPATLEALETRGVLLVGYRTDELPGFLLHSTGLPMEHRVETPDEAAEIVRAHRALGLPGAIVLAQPVPAEQALDPDVFQTALDDALRQATVQRISGKRLTPFLLDLIRQATRGQSLLANCALLVANARLAARVAALLICPSSQPVSRAG
jgi:pseudouridylate synthase